MEVHMDGFEGRRGWVLALVVVLASAAVGLVGYNIGISHGMAQGAGTDANFYGWHRPWGFGFMFPLLFFFAWVVLFRGLWWGFGGPWRHRYYYPGEYGPHPRFDEWHRRAHDRMKENPPADDPGRRG